MGRTTIERHAVDYGTREITFTLERRRRKTLTIEVHPDGQVQVIAPLDAALEEIRSRVARRGAWIAKQQRTFQNYPPPLPQREFVSGEGYRYLGRQYRLKVVSSAEDRVRLWRGRLEVSVRDGSDSARVGTLVRNWYRHRAKLVFQERYDSARQLVALHGIVHESGFRLLKMEKRWGSCTPTGILLLNPLLVSAAKECIDYVMVHELIHTVEHNHGPDFYRLLARVMPDWEERRFKLNSSTEAVSW